MKIYLYTPDTTAGTARCVQMYLELIARISTGNAYLPRDATVWGTVLDRSLGLWVLGETSTFLKVRSTVDAGACILDRSRVRFGATTRAALAATADSESVAGIPAATSGDPATTIILDHGQPDKRVTFRAGSSMFSAPDGVCTYDPFTVVDLPNYTAPDHATSDPFTSADAMHNGVNLMVQGLNYDEADYVRHNVERFRLPEEVLSMDNVSKAGSALEKAAAGVCKYIREQVDKDLKHRSAPSPKGANTAAG
jgi:hypothetical protein